VPQILEAQAAVQKEVLEVQGLEKMEWHIECTDVVFTQILIRMTKQLLH
jgi:hypothetical protein